MMLDEIDKLGAGIQGDPGGGAARGARSEQNNTFRDNYLGVPFDLSRVVFITTANMLDTIPGPLRDRMEIISLAGYTAEREAADRAALSGAAAAGGERPQAGAGRDRRRRAARDHPALHARSGRAQSRARDRQGAAPCRGAHRRRRRADRSASSADDLAAILGAAAVRERGRRCAPACRASRPGSPGRRSAATSCSSRRRACPGSGRLILTGQLGDVMKESAQAALSIVKNRAGALGIDPARFEKSDIHVHVPAGAIPKDGPSAGVAMFMALVSLMTERHDPQRHGDDRRDQPARAGAAGRRHQGEGRRRGARRHRRASCCRRATGGLRGHPGDARRDIEFVWLERVDDAVAAALEPARPAENAPSSVPQLAGAEA